MRRTKKCTQPHGRKTLAPKGEMMKAVGAGVPHPQPSCGSSGPSRRTLFLGRRPERRELVHQPPELLGVFGLEGPFPGLGEVAGTPGTLSPPAFPGTCLLCGGRLSLAAIPGRRPLPRAIPEGHVHVHGPLGAGCCSLLPNCRCPC